MWKNWRDIPQLAFVHFGHLAPNLRVYSAYAVYTSYVMIVCMNILHNDHKIVCGDHDNILLDDVCPDVLHDEHIT